MISYSSLPNKLISAPNGVDFAYGDTGDGEGGVPLVLFQHFRGNLDNWDPALIDALAPAQRVIIGSFVAQQVALTKPAIVRRLVLASAPPQGAAGMHGWAPEVIGAIGTLETSPREYLSVFFARSSASQQAGQQALQRMHARTENRDTATTWATRQAQYDAVCVWGIPDHASSSGSAPSTCRCSWPTATATR